MKPSDPSLESRWVDGIRRGDSGAFTQLFDAFYERLCAFAEGFVSSPDVAEELVEEVFFRIWKQRNEWRLTGSLKGYLYTAVRNQALKHLDHEAVKNRTEQEVALSGRSPGMSEPTPSVEAQLDAKELGVAVQQAVVALPERCREAFLLHRQHGLSYAEIAQVMEIAVSSVEKHLIRAMRILRESLEPWIE